MEEKTRSLGDITAEEVIAAYKQTGLKPAAGHFFIEDGCTCALGALMVAAGKHTGDGASYAENLREMGFGDVVASYTAYALSFDAGYMGESARSSSYPVSYLRAWKIGRAVREAEQRGEL